MRALTAERYGTPVREWTSEHRSRPLADQLDDLAALKTFVALEVIEREAG
jgi:hypothetical protein